MKKKIGISCGVFTLFALVWIGARHISVAAETIKEEKLLYAIKTSSGSSLGVAPIVNGKAVVMLDSSNMTVRQGNYMPPEEQSAFSLKKENEIAKAASEGKVGAWAFYREALLQDFAFQDGVTAIEKFAFARSGLKSVTMPEGVTSIGYGAFYHCDALINVTIPKSVTVIEENAFAYTPWLKNWLARTEEKAENADAGDFLIVGDGILLAYRGSEKNPTLPEEVKSVAPGALGE